MNDTITSSDDVIYVDFNGRRFYPPFLCFCCGREVAGRQFAFGRMCGACDSGACQSTNVVGMTYRNHALFDFKEYLEKQVRIPDLPQVDNKLIQWLKK